jgi:hypothetical protein
MNRGVARLAPAALALVLAAGCGGGGGETVTVTTTVTDEAAVARAEEAGARALARDLCASLPVAQVAQFALGVEGDDAQAVAEALAAEVSSDLRAAAVAGCISALREE